MGDFGFDTETNQVYVKKLHAGYPAAKCGVIWEGDVIATVNDQPATDVATTIDLLNMEKSGLEIVEIHFPGISIEMPAAPVISLSRKPSWRSSRKPTQRDLWKDEEPAKPNENTD